MEEPSAESRGGPVWAGPFLHSRRVEFSDTDMAGVVHFAQYFRYMENAEHEYWRSIGYSAFGRFDGIRVGWPRVHAECHFRRPLHFEDLAQVEVYVVSVGKSSVEFRHAVFRGDPAGQQLAATGRITVACIDMDRGADFASIMIPPSLRERIAVAPPESFTRQ
jgi:acyl-CoA thioester hydrolase